MDEDTTTEVRLAASPGSARLHSVALTDLHGGLVVDRRSAHALLDLACHRQEGLLHVRCTLGRSLKKRNAKTVSELLSIINTARLGDRSTDLGDGIVNDLLVGHIGFIAHQ